jgi:hypothetical protein
MAQQPQGRLPQEYMANTKIQSTNDVKYTRGNKKITPKNNSISNTISGKDNYLSQGKVSKYLANRPTVHKQTEVQKQI